MRLREWRPWPGERVVVRVTRPEGVEGPTLTLDGSQLAVSPGLRATRASLELRLRSSLGGQHAIQLPEGAVLERVTIDGAEQPIRQEGREVMLPLTPGTRTLGLAWQEPRGITTRFAVARGRPARAERERGRHALAAGGPLAAVGERPAPGTLGPVLAAARGARGPGRRARPDPQHAAAQLALAAARDSASRRRRSPRAPSSSAGCSRSAGAASMAWRCAGAGSIWCRWRSRSGRSRRSPCSSTRSSRGCSGFRRCRSPATARPRTSCAGTRTGRKRRCPGRGCSRSRCSPTAP